MMSFERRRNLRKKTVGTSPEILPTAKKGRRPYKIAAAILAIFAVHFAWQFSFIQKENLRIAQDSLNNARLAVLPVETQPEEKTAEIKPDLTPKKTAVEETAKNVVRVKYSPPENNRPPVEVKKNPASQPRSERLRRAEKLLTGF